MKYNYIIKQYNLSNKIIFDAGCGTGLFFSFLINKILKESEIISSFFYIGVDISYKMLEEFRLKLNEKYRDSKNKVNLNILKINYKFRILFFNLFSKYKKIMLTSNNLNNIE